MAEEADFDEEGIDWDDFTFHQYLLVLHYIISIPRVSVFFQHPLRQHRAGQVAPLLWQVPEGAEGREAELFHVRRACHAAGQVLHLRPPDFFCRVLPSRPPESSTNHSTRRACH